MDTKEKIKIMLVDDHLVVRMGIASILSFEPDFEIIGQADSGAEALSMLQILNPDVVIMDLMMPDMDGVTATRQILSAHPNIRILVLTSFGTSIEVHGAIEAGATGVLVKTSTQEEICSAIRLVFNGQNVLSPEIKNTLKCSTVDTMISERQKEILRLIANGYSNKEIARILDIGTNCVKYHLRVVFANLGASTRAEAISIAHERRMI
jgi:DNA-binding NarL/FixJ family response regulator